MIITPYGSRLGKEVWLALFTMLYVDFLDTSGTLLGLGMELGIIDQEGNFPESTRAFCVDAIATMVGKSTTFSFCSFSQLTTPPRTHTIFSTKHHPKDLYSVFPRSLRT